MTSILRRRSFAIALLCSVSAPAIAQQVPGSVEPGPAETAAAQPESGLADIVVTAQRRSESLQNAALAVSAVSGDVLAQRGISRPEQLTQLVPALQVTQVGGPYVTYTMRGVTSQSSNAFADPALAVNFNQVYLATPTGSAGLFYDLERIEVLKGPQGTLYGRNATGGAINVIPRRPQLGTASGEVGMEAGDYKLAGGFAAANVPIADTLAMRVAGQAKTRSGFYTDGTGDEHAVALRGSLLFAPTANFSVVVVGDTAHVNDRGGGSSVRKACGTGQACFVAQPWTGLQDLPQAYVPLAPPSRQTYSDSYYYGVSAIAELRTDFATLTVVPAYRKSNIRLQTTVPGFFYRTFDDPDQTSLEARLASDDSHPLRWLMGAYYLTSSINSFNNSESAAGRSFSANFLKLSGHSLAGFGQLTWAMTPHFRATGGVRYTYEKKSAGVLRYSLPNTVGPVFAVVDTPPAGLAPTVNFNDSATYDAVTWRGGVEWDAGRRSLLYANVTTGFKAGGFFTGPPGNNTYKPEKVTSYALGSKNRFWDNRLQLNIEAFLQDYKDQQINYIKVVGGSAIQFTENVGQARMKGLDVEAVGLITPTTRLSVQGQYLHSEYRSLIYSTVSPPAATSKCSRTPGTGGTLVNCSGQSALRSPEFIISGGIDQTIRLGSTTELVASIFGRHQSSKELDLAYIPETHERPHNRFDGSITYNDKKNRFSIGAFVNNITNDAEVSTLTVSPSYAVNGVVSVSVLPPRTYGLRLNGKF